MARIYSELGGWITLSKEPSGVAYLFRVLKGGPLFA